MSARDLVKEALERVEAWRDSHRAWEQQHNRVEDKNAAENYDHVAQLLRKALRSMENGRRRSVLSDAEVRYDDD